MKKKNVLIVGSGNRVQKTILPAILCLKDIYTLCGVYSRKQKILINDSRFGIIKTIRNLSLIDFQSLDIIIVAITTENVPELLALLSSFNTKHIRLLLDTPVLRIKHLWALKYFKLFKEVYISEDYISMKVYDMAKQIIKSGKIGNLRHIYLFHSGYKHHALAIIKNLASLNYISLMHVEKRGNNITETKIRLPNGVSATILGPRDYSIGRFLIIGDSGFISDYSLSGHNGIIINYLYKNGYYSGIAISGLFNKQFEFKNRYYNKLIDILSDKSLINNLKIEGLIIMLKNLSNKLSYRYLPESGIYDNLSIKILSSLGFFYDVNLPFTKLSIINIFIKILKKIY